MLDDLVRQLVEECVRRVVREELALLVRYRQRSDRDTAEYLTVAEVARSVGVATNTVRAWIAKGLRRHQVGRVVRISRADLDSFLRTQHAEAQCDPDEHAAEILARRERR